MPTLYEEQPSLPFTTEELGNFHRFHAYNWDEDKAFQEGLNTITQSQPSPSEATLLKIKQYYFSTRLSIRIHLDHYLDWRKHLDKPTDDPNVSIFKRFDAHNFDTDARFQQGLPTLISQLVKEGKNALDKEELQKEMTKAKAFYYSRFIEPFNLLAYLNWKEMSKSQQGPACPFAHLWQNKGKGGGSELPDDPRQFVTTKDPVSTGALQLHIHSPGTQNRLTAGRMAKLSKTLVDAVDNDTVTSIYWTVNSGSSSLTHRDPESQIVTKDEKWFSGGIVLNPEAGLAQKQDTLKQYFTVVDQILTLSQKHEKPVVTIVDGMVALSSAYLALCPTGQVVISENAALAFTPSETLCGSENQIVNPFAGLYLLALIQSGRLEANTVRPLAKGTGLYLAFHPDYILRGPDLKKLGLANYFIPSKKNKDIEESVLAVAGCPPPHTAKAVRMSLNAEVEYPGPAKIDVWRDEVEECFGESTSLQDVVTRLEKYNNKWSKDIREYIASLDPLLAKLIYKAIIEASKLNTFEDVVRLEYRLFTRYTQLSASEKSEAGEDLDVFFEPLDNEAESDLLKFSFNDWLKNGGAEAEEAELDRQLAAANTVSGMPADHPMIPSMANLSAVEMADAAAKGCPHFAAQLEFGDATKTDSSATLPSDHPTVPGMMGLSEAEMADAAAKGCPHFASQLSNNGTVDAVKASVIPVDHPMVPGLTNLTADEMADAAAKGCPHFAQQMKSDEKVASVPSADNPTVSGLDLSAQEMMEAAVKGCPHFEAMKSSPDSTKPPASELVDKLEKMTIPDDHPPVPGMGNASMCPSV